MSPFPVAIAACVLGLSFEAGLSQLLHHSLTLANRALVPTAPRGMGRITKTEEVSELAGSYSQEF